MNTFYPILVGGEREREGAVVADEERPFLILPAIVRPDDPWAPCIAKVVRH
jgi:hypothetical protein